jgi:endonuclease YncB( thermonuclease family)
MKIKRLCSITVLALFALSALARDPVGTVLTGDVVKIADGDTLTLLTADKEQVKIRLAEIDTPERKQPYYQKAKQALADRVFRETIAVEIIDWDRYGRAVGKISLNGEHVNAWMVAEGHAWVYRKYSDDPKMLELETAAREKKLGIWGLSESEQMPPWEWRRRSRK